MSLILEALKKSESERRLGQAPGLMTPMRASHYGDDRRRFGAILAMALLLSALGGAAWWALRPVVETSERGPSTMASTPADTSKPADVAIPPLPIDPETVSAPAATAASETEVTAPSTPPTTPPAALRSTAPAEDVDLPAPRDPEFDSVERESAAVMPDTLERPVEPAAPTTPAARESEAIAREASPGVPPAPPIAGDPLGIAAAELPRFDQLPASERESLPPLKLSMHLYTDAPATRFALIDGRRYTDGERIAESLRVVEVRRDGVELDFNGRRFLLPRP